MHQVFVVFGSRMSNISIYRLFLYLADIIGLIVSDEELENLHISR